MILRKAYGGAYLAMCGKDLGADRVFAWPTAEVAVMGAEGAVEIVFRKEIQEAEDKAAKRAELIETYREAFSNPYVAAGRAAGGRRHRAADTRRAPGPGARIPADQAGTPAAQETRPDPAVGGEGKLMAKVTVTELATTLEELQAQLAALSRHIAYLEKRHAGANGAAKVPAPAAAPPAQAAPPAVAEITEEELLAISAAVAAYLGVRAHIRQIRLIRTRAWAQQGRVSIQASHRLQG